MLERLTPVRRNFVLAVLGLLLVWFGWTIRSVLNPLILGYLLAYTVHPMVVKLESKGWKRRRAVNLIYVTGFVVISLVILGVAAQMNSLIRSRDAENKSLIRNATDRLDVFTRDHAEWFTFLTPEEEPAAEATSTAPGDLPVTSEQVVPPAGDLPEGEVAGDVVPAEEEGLGFFALMRTLWERIGEEDSGGREVAVRNAGSAWSLARRFFGSIVALFGLIVLLPIYSYFLLFELGRIHGFVRRYLPIRERERFSRIGRQVGEVLANFFRGRLLVCLLKGGFITLGLFVTGVDYALLIGMASGFLSLIPFIGPAFGFLFAASVALLDPAYGVVGALIRTGVVFAIAEALEGYVLIPKILGDSLGLHPVVVLVSVFAGGAALGMFGFLIALPLTAALVILVRELVLPALAAFADES
jgi:predicted PurR-regulated permease PerM